MAVDPGVLDQMTMDGINAHRRAMARIDAIADNAVQNGTTVANHTTQATAAMVATEIGTQNDPDRVAAFQTGAGVPAQGAVRQP